MALLEVLLKYLAWPFVTLILGGTGLFLLRRPLGNLIDRTRKIGKVGLEAAAATQEEAAEAKPKSADEFLKIFDNALLVQRETFIRTEIDRSGVAQGAERERVLIRLLAAAAIIQTFERTYVYIWGSQITALQFLNSAGAEGVDDDLLRPWYDQAAAREPDRYGAYNFDQWLGFLQANLLVLRNEGRVNITLEGREFLKYLLHQGYSLYKGG
jgi:hypothetical protein